MSRANKQKERDIIKEIHDVCNKKILSDDDKQKLVLLHSSLDKMYVSKARGTYTVSGQKQNG